MATGDAASFMEHVRQWNPSVVTIDLNMPGTDGIQLLREMVETNTRARILIASGVDPKVLEAAGKLVGERGLVVAGVLSKPIRAEVLRETLERLLDVEKPLMAGALAHAIANDHLTLHYQPKLDCKTRQVYGVEALVRWQHPSRGLIMPDDFIPLAEQSGVIDELTGWVMKTAARQAAAFRRDGMRLEMAVNVSARNLENIELPDLVASICAEAELATDGVTVELTESAAMGDAAQTMDVLTRFRLKGFRLSIDDFGTGYSSLKQLRRLPFSELKIDKSFVMEMCRSEDSRAIVEAVIGMAHKLGLSVVAEGVETAEILALLTSLACDTAQGYHIAKPATADRIVVGQFSG